MKDISNNKSGVCSESSVLELLSEYHEKGNVAGTVYNCGPAAASDRDGTTDGDFRMMIISDADKGSADAYINKLNSDGFVTKYVSDTEENVFYTLEKSGSFLYLYYVPGQRIIRIIEERSENLPCKFSYSYDKSESETTELYQYSLNYTNPSVKYAEASNEINCGMLYIIKLADNRLVVIDGGHTRQSTPLFRKKLLEFMRNISRTGEDDKVEIAAWFFSHAHGDHVELAADFIDEFYDSIDIKRVMYNFPSYHVIQEGYEAAGTFDMKEIMQNRFPDAQFLKLHTGQTVRFADVSFDVLFTHEDAVDENGHTKIVDFNASSTVLKITFDGKTVMLLGDISEVSADIMLNMYTARTLNSDMVQISHHGFNSLERLYEAINAPIALVPQSAINAQDASNINKFKNYTRNSPKVYFADENTYKFTVVNGEVKACKLPRYDEN